MILPQSVSTAANCNVYELSRNYPGHLEKLRCLVCRSMPEAAPIFQNWEQISGGSRETATDQTEKWPPRSSVVKIATVIRLDTTSKQNYNKMSGKSEVWMHNFYWSCPWRQTSWHPAIKSVIKKNSERHTKSWRGNWWGKVFIHPPMWVIFKYHISTKGYFMSYY